MSRRRASKYLQLEAESGSEDHEPEEYSEDLDNLNPISPVPKAKTVLEFTQELENKYQSQHPSNKDVQEEDYEEEEVLEAPTQTALLPTFRSPLLFLVRCRIGKEKDIVYSLYEHIKKSTVCSAIYKEGLKGYIYVEAYKKQDVEDLLSTTRNVFRKKLSVVPFKEMVEAISYRKSIIVGEFARIKGGKYKGDLVCVMENFEDVVKAKLVPRIDNKKKLFDPNEHRNEIISQDGGFYYNRDFFQDGFLIKIMLKQNLDFEAEPTFEELQELKMKGWFNINDPVKISKGDLKNLIGTVESLNGNVAVILSNNIRYEVNLDEIEKHYDPGQEVSFKGENGVVLKVNDRQIILGMDNFTREIVCMINEVKPPVTEKRALPTAPMRLKARRDPLINRHVRILGGDYKGLSGTVKDAFQERCIVQLRSNLKQVSVERRFVNYEAPSAKLVEKQYNESYGSKTPSFKTPAFKTPSYRTPSFKTPMVGNGNKYAHTYTNEEAGVDWLASEYDGGEIKVNGKSHIITDVVGGYFKTKTGDMFFSHEVEYIQPEMYDRVIILEGKDKGVQGTLVSIADTRGRIKDKDEKEYHVDLKMLTKKAE